MDAVLSEGLSMLLRWLHLIAAMAWIGSSFYFMHLDYSLRAREGLPGGVKGDAWQVHGGGFYHMVKYLVAPAHMPDELTWFKWEAYATWLSGFGLLAAVYYLNAELFLVERTTLDLLPWQAIALSVLFLAVPWLLYEAMCRSPLGANETLLALVGYAFLVLLTFGFTQVFSGRGAFIQIGALIGTMMVANVFAVIIPNQKKIVAALLAGREPDPAWGAAGKQRSVHNNYLTLPVVFLMMSNHYPLLFATRFNWVIVALVLPVGAVIRHFYNVRHAGNGNPWWAWAAAAAGVLAILWLSAAGPAPEGKGAEAPPSSATHAAAAEVLTTRCSMCHAAEPVWAGIAHPPKGVSFDGPDALRRYARLIDEQAVRSRAMPPGNVTEMTDAERQLLGRWIAAAR